MNEALRARFLDLKEGAIVVSLKPFVPPNARVTERNVGEPFHPPIDVTISCSLHRSTIFVLFSTLPNGHIGLAASRGGVVEGHTICIASIGWGMRM